MCSKLSEKESSNGNARKNTTHQQNCPDNVWGEQRSIILSSHQSVSILWTGTESAGYWFIPTVSLPPMNDDDELHCCPLPCYNNELPQGEVHWL